MQSPGARKWTFEAIVNPLLLAPETNTAQSGLISSFLSMLGPEETDIADGLLQLLVPRLVAALETGQPVRSLVESVMALLRRLENRAINGAVQLIHTLLTVGLFPEVRKAPATVAVEGLGDVYVAGFSQALQASRRSPACREACFDLVVELMLHDRACWDTGCSLLQSLVIDVSEILPKQYYNKPLTSLRSAGALAGLQNGGATCYMNATFQQLFMQPTVRQLILSAPAVPPEERENSVFHQVQLMFAHLAAGVEPWYEPRGFWRAFKDYEGHPVNIREHQDAYEFFTRLQDSVDEHLRSAGAPPAIQSALGGAFAQVITVAGRPELRSERDEEFYQISLDVRGKRGLEESLESYVAVELMDGQNQWHCEELNAKVDAEKRTLIRRLPHTLMLHLKRFEWDYETYSRWKVKDRFEFPMELDMKPYTVEAGADDGSGDGSGGGGGDASGHPDAYYKYELRGIVVHSGTAFAGHYYSYARDRNDGIWYCFDDTTVEPWDPATMDADCFGGKFIPDGSNQEYNRPHSAYMLVYERVEVIDKEAEADKHAAAAAAGNIHSKSSLPELEELSKAAAAAAIPGAYDAILAANPATQAELITHNSRQLAILHGLSSEFLGVFTTIINHARMALGGTARPRKVARSGGLTSPGNGGQGLLGGGTGSASQNAPHGALRKLLSSQSGDFEAVLGQVTTLCLEYFCRLVARAWDDLYQEISTRRQRSLVAGLVNLNARSEGAMATLTYASAAATLPHVTAAIGSIVEEVRESLHKQIVGSLRTVCDARGVQYALENIQPLFDHFVNTAASDLASRPRSTHLWEEVISVLSNIVTLDDELCVLGARNLDAICSMATPVGLSWGRLQAEDRGTYDFGPAYLSLLGTSMRHYWPGTLASRSPSRPNPLCISAGPDGTHPQLPRPAWEFLFPPGSQTFGHLLLTGCVRSRSASRFLMWIMWNNDMKYRSIMEGLLIHVGRDLVRSPDLAAEVLYLAEAMGLTDRMLETRYEDLLWGLETRAGSPPPISRGLLDISMDCRFIVRSVLMIRLITMLQYKCPDAFRKAMEMDPMKAREWRNWALDTLGRFADHLDASRPAAVVWNDICRENPDLARTLKLDEMQELILEGEDDAQWPQGDLYYDDEDPEPAGRDGGGGPGGNVQYSELLSARGFGLLPGGIGPLPAQQHQQQQEDDDDDNDNDGNVASAAVITRPADILAAGAPGPAAGADALEDDDEEPVAEIDLGDSDGDGR